MAAAAVKVRWVVQVRHQQEERQATYQRSICRTLAPFLILKQAHLAAIHELQLMVVPRAAKPSRTCNTTRQQSSPAVREEAAHRLELQRLAGRKVRLIRGEVSTQRVLVVAVAQSSTQRHR